MTATDQLRAALRDLEAKARELELDKKLETFAEKADTALRDAAVKAGEYAHDNRGRVEETLDKAGAKVDEKTEGKYARYVDKLRTGVLVGVDWVAQQRESSSTPTWSDGTRWGSTPDAGAAPVDDVSPAGSADSDAWVDVTDSPPPAPGPTDPR